MTATKRDAQAVTRLVAKLFGADGSHHPKLLEDFDGHPFVIVWEGGPFQWTYQFPYGGVNEELYSLALEFGGDVAARVAEIADVADRLPAGVEVDTLTHYSIAVR